MPRLVPAVRSAAPPPPPLRFAAYGGEACAYIRARDGSAWTAELVDGGDWLVITSGASGAGDGLVTLTAGASTGPEREGRLVVRESHGAILCEYAAIQMSAAPLATLNTSVLELPFPAMPRVMELAIAGKFLGKEISKLPPPVEVVVLALVEALVALLGELAIALRAALAAVVPEPKTWFGAPGIYDALSKIQPATAVFIQQETDLLLAYLPIEVANEGQ